MEKTDRLKTLMDEIMAEYDDAVSCELVSEADDLWEAYKRIHKVLTQYKRRGIRREDA